MKEYRTRSGILVKAFYTAKDISEAEYDDKLGDPGRYPFTRGVYQSMYRHRLWTMRQYSGFGVAEESNKRLKFLIKEGQTGLSIAFDLPTQLGYDSDHERADGEVGRVGVPISSVRDMEVLFGGISLSQVSTSMTINATASIMLADYMTVADIQQVAIQQIRGTTQNDILKEFVARNTYTFPPDHSLKLAVDLIQYCTTQLPKWHPISISGYHMREAGATAVQELAYAFSNAICYVDACLQRGMKLEDFAPKLSFFFTAGSDFFEEVAKFRAARRIWAKIMRERYEAKDDESCKLRFHVQTSGETLTAQQPENNTVRVTVQALAAVLGGAQSIHTNSRDEALSLPTEESVKLALRTQQILAQESGIARTADPLGGSYHVESLTNTLEDQVLKEMKEVERLGGALRAIEEGYMQSRIRDSAYRYQREVESGERILVGVNAFVDDSPIAIGLHRVVPEATEMQIRRLKELKERRDGRKAELALSRIVHAAEGGSNLVPSIVEGVRAMATTGEISDALRGVYGEYRPRTWF